MRGKKIRCPECKTILTNNSVNEESDLRQELNELKARVNKIEDYLSGNYQPTTKKEPEATYEVLDLKIQKSQNMHDWDEYAYLLTVKNTCTKDLKFNGNIIFNDSTGFEVCREYISSFTVKSGTTHTKSGQSVITDKVHKSRISEITAEINPW